MRREPAGRLTFRERSDQTMNEDRPHLAAQVQLTCRLESEAMLGEGVGGTGH